MEQELKTSFNAYVEMGEQDYECIEKELRNVLLLATSFQQCPQVEVSEYERTLIKLVIGIYKSKKGVGIAL